MRANIYLRSTFPRPDEPTARARTARSTPSTRSPVSRPGYPSIRAHTESWQSTRQERLRCLPRESVVMIASSPVTEVKPSPSSTRYDCCTPLFSSVLTQRTEGEDHQEGRSPSRVHTVQDQGTGMLHLCGNHGTSTNDFQLALKRCKHFELGGDKKTKGAALVF
jgi:hypothetical protein